MSEKEEYTVDDIIEMIELDDDIEDIIEKVKDINVLGEDGLSPLHVASKKNKYRVLDLISAGANINIQDEEGITPLHTAAELGKKDIVSELINSGADVNIEDIYGNTPVHAALNQDRFVTAKKLIQAAGMNVNIQNAEGITPLHIAVKSSNKKAKDIISELLSKGADVNIKDDKGKRPIDYATDPEIKDLLETHAKKLLNMYNISDVSSNMSDVTFNMSNITKKRLENILNTSDVNTNTHEIHSISNNIEPSIDAIKDKIEPRIKGGRALTKFDKLIIEIWTDTPYIYNFILITKIKKINELFRIGKYLIKDDSEIEKMIDEKLIKRLNNKISRHSDPIQFSKLMYYYYFISLYNVIQKRPINTNKIFRVFRGVQQWYLSKNTDSFSYINSFTSTTLNVDIAKGFAVKGGLGEQFLGNLKVINDFINGSKLGNKIYIFYAHPLCRFMNIDSFSAAIGEEELVFAPYNRYIYVETRKAGDFTYRIYCVLPTDLKIPDTFDEFLTWKDDIVDKTSEYEKERVKEELRKDMNEMAGGKLALMDRPRVNRNMRNITKKKGVNMGKKKARSVTRKRNTVKKSVLEKQSMLRWIEPLHAFEGKKPTKAEWGIIEQMKKVIEKAKMFA